MDFAPQTDYNSSMHMQETTSTASTDLAANQQLIPSKPAAPSRAELTQNPHSLAAPQGHKPSDVLERNSLRLAGMLNLVGDVGFLVNGINTANPYKFMGGLSYTLGGVNLTYYGCVDKQHVIDEVIRKSANYLESRCGQLPHGCQLSRLRDQQPDSIFAKGDRYLHKNPAQHTMALYTAGAGALLGSGIQNYKQGEGSAGLLYGLSSLGFKLTSMVIPEKAANAPEKKSGLIGWIQEKPLRLFGYGSLMTDSLLAWESYQEFKHAPGKSGYVWTALSGGTYMLSDIMMAISHKDPANGAARFTHLEQEYIAHVMADAINRLDSSSRLQMSHDVATFLSSQPEIHESSAQLSQMIQKALEEKQGKSWASRAQPRGEGSIAIAI